MFVFRPNSDRHLMNGGDGREGIAVSPNVLLLAVDLTGAAIAAAVIVPILDIAAMVRAPGIMARPPQA